MSKIKKIVGILIVAVIIIFIFSCTYAANQFDAQTDETATELITIKESTNNKLAGYADKYGSTTYGLVAYILNTVRIYSIPFCFVGIVVGSIYQYVIGIRRLDTRDKGFALIITFVTLLLICQVLPLIFAIIVNGWRG